MTTCSPGTTRARPGRRGELACDRGGLRRVHPLGDRGERVTWLRRRRPSLGRAPPGRRRASHARPGSSAPSACSGSGEQDERDDDRAEPRGAPTARQGGRPHRGRSGGEPTDGGPTAVGGERRAQRCRRGGRPRDGRQSAEGPRRRVRGLGAPERLGPLGRGVPRGPARGRADGAAPPDEPEARLAGPCAVPLVARAVRSPSGASWSRGPNTCSPPLDHERLFGSTDGQVLRAGCDGGRHPPEGPSPAAEPRPRARRTARASSTWPPSGRRVGPRAGRTRPASAGSAWSPESVTWPSQTQTTGSARARRRESAWRSAGPSTPLPTLPGAHRRRRPPPVREDPRVRDARRTPGAWEYPRTNAPGAAPSSPASSSLGERHRAGLVDQHDAAPPRGTAARRPGVRDRSASRAGPHARDARAPRRAARVARARAPRGRAPPTRSSTSGAKAPSLLVAPSAPWRAIGRRGRARAASMIAAKRARVHREPVGQVARRRAPSRRATRSSRARAARSELALERRGTPLAQVGSHAADPRARSRERSRCRSRAAAKQTSSTQLPVAQRGAGP